MIHYINPRFTLHYTTFTLQGRIILFILFSILPVILILVNKRLSLLHGHCRQMPRADDVEGAYERWLQNILNIR